MLFNDIDAIEVLLQLLLLLLVLLLLLLLLLLHARVTETIIKMKQILNQI